MQRVRLYEAIDFRRWVGICSLEYGDGRWYECYWLKLPCYGWHYCFWRDRDEWCQLIWFWHGKMGFQAFWQPVPDQPSGKPTE